MAEGTSEIREQIAQTREELAGTVDALGAKVDVPGRVKGWASDKKQAISEKGHAVTSGVTGHLPSREGMRGQAGRVKGIAEENPLGLAIAGAAVGFLVGLAVPSTRVEDERVGSVADDVKEKARETGREALERGKHVAQATAQTALETAREEGETQAKELAESVRETGQQPADQRGADAG